MKSTKAATSTGKFKTDEEVSIKATENAVIPEERHHMIAEAAYFRAEHRGLFKAPTWSEIGLSLKLKLITYWHPSLHSPTLYRQ